MIHFRMKLNTVCWFIIDFKTSYLYIIRAGDDIRILHFAPERAN